MGGPEICFGASFALISKICDFINIDGSKSKFFFSNNGFFNLFYCLFSNQLKQNAPNSNDYYSGNISST